MCETNSDIQVYLFLICCVSTGSYEGWEGGSFPCIRVKRNHESLPRLVVIIIIL